MLRSLRLLGLGLVLALPLACGPAGDPEPVDHAEGALRALTTQEALAELAQVGAAIKAGYGPLEYKRARFGLDIDQVLAQARSEIEAATTEAERVAPFYRLVAKLRDGHVSFSFPLRATESVASSLPFFLTPVEGSFLVAASYNPTLGIAVGDRCLSIDGVPVEELAAKILPYADSGTPGYVRHNIAAAMTQRPFFAPKELAPRGPRATVVLERPDGTSYTVEAAWFAQTGGLLGQIRPPPNAAPGPITSGDEGTFSPGLAWTLDPGNPLASDGQAETSRLAMGQPTPYFLTEAVKSALGTLEVKPKPETLEAFGVVIPESDATLPDRAKSIHIRAYKYGFEGKTVLLVRIPGFITPTGAYDQNVGYLGALLKDNLVPREVVSMPSPEAPGIALLRQPADVVVIDVTHNPGGSPAYVSGLATMFATKPIPNVLQANRVDRGHLGMLLSMVSGANADPAAREIALARLQAGEAAHDAGNLLGPFIPFGASVMGPKVTLTPVERLGLDVLQPHPLVQWNKPVLVLHDELSGSGGDAFPLVLQNGGVARTFGHTTAGMGGSVSPAPQLPYSSGSIRLTRGLFGTRAPDGQMRLIENVGVAPDYPYNHTIADHRAGFVGYATAFSKVATQLTRPQ